jgi:hypothetical protein
MIQVHWDQNHSISCRSQDLLQSEKMKGVIMMNDLNFSRFISMIMKKLKYNNWQDMIVYERIGMTTMHIANKLKWRTALSEMHTEIYTVLLCSQEKNRKSWLWVCWHTTQS